MVYYRYRLLLVEIDCVPTLHKLLTTNDIWKLCNLFNVLSLDEAYLTPIA